MSTNSRGPDNRNLCFECGAKATKTCINCEEPLCVSCHNVDGYCISCRKIIVEGEDTRC